MTTIMQLAERRAAAQMRVNSLAMVNQPVKWEDQLKADASYRLAQDALARCEKEYQDALGAMTTTDLVNLTK